MTETRYRRLLALYPRDFRREYADEMTGVLLSDPRPGPRLVADVVRGAATAWFRQAVAPGADWQRAARVVQVFGAMLLLALALRRVGAPLGPIRWFDDLGAVDLLRIACWATVVLGALTGVRWVATAGAAIGLAGEIASPLRYYLDTPASVLHVYGIIVAAALVLAAGLSAEAGHQARPRGWPVGLAATALIGMTDLFSPVLRTIYPRNALLIAVLAVLAGGVVLLQPRVLRRRLLVWAAPLLTAAALVQFGFAGFIEHNMRHPEATRMLGAGQISMLILVPPLAFVVGATVLRRWEARLRASGGGDLSRA